MLKLSRAISISHQRRSRILHLDNDPVPRMAVAFAARHSASYTFAESMDEARRELRDGGYDLVVLNPRIANEGDLARTIDSLPRRPLVAYLSIPSDRTRAIPVASSTPETTGWPEADRVIARAPASHAPTFVRR